MIIKVYTANDEGKEECFALGLNINDAVAADHVNFIHNILELIQTDKESLEKEANASGRTLDHSFGGIGSISTGPKS